MDTNGTTSRSNRRHNQPSQQRHDQPLTRQTDIMACNMSGPRHWSGFCSNTQRDAVARKMADCLLCLGFLVDASKWLVEQGLKRPDKLLTQTDKTIDDYVAVCRKPGGGEKGHVCSMEAVALLKQVAWGARHMQPVDRKLDTLKISEKWCQGWAHQIDLEKNWDNDVSSNDYPKAGLAKQPAKLFEALETLLGRMRGVTGIPLLRIVRKDIQGRDKTGPQGAHVHLDF